MLAKSKRLVKLPLHIALLFMICLTLGCSKEKDVRRMIAENSCKDILDNPVIKERTRKLARKVLEAWNNRVLDPEPVLIHAGYFKKPNEKCSRLFLTMSDEEYDIAGIGVREFHKQLKSNTTVVEEEYPIFPEPKIGHFQLIAFEERKALSQGKDDEAWNNYLNSRADRLFIYRRREYPVVWISLPNPPKVEVELWIYDFAGNKSEPVSLEYGLPGKGMKKPVAVSENSDDR